MIRRSLLAPLAILVATGCAADLGCPAVGCTSGATFVLSDLGPLPKGKLTVHACLDAVCVDMKQANPTQITVETPETGPRAAVASITISKGETILVQGSVPVQVTQRPTSPEVCDAICYRASVLVTADGLRAVTP